MLPALKHGVFSRGFCALEHWNRGTKTLEHCYFVFYAFCEAYVDPIPNSSQRDSMISCYMVFSEDIEDRSLHDLGSFQYLMKTKSHQMFVSFKNRLWKISLLPFLLRLRLWYDATICILMETLENPKQREGKRFNFLISKKQSILT